MEKEDSNIWTNKSLLIPIMTVIIGAIGTISVGLLNNRNAIIEKQLERETAIIMDALEANKQQERIDLLRFYVEIGLIDVPVLEQKIKEGKIKPPKRKK